MARYNPPEGFVPDQNTGLYYTQVIAVDDAGNRSQVVTWFNPETGQYRQDVYPVDESRISRDKHATSNVQEDRHAAVRRESRPGVSGKKISRTAGPGSSLNKRWIIAAAALVVTAGVVCALIFALNGRDKSDGADEAPVITDNVAGNADNSQNVEAMQISVTRQQNDVASSVEGNASDSAAREETGEVTEEAVSDEAVETDSAEENTDSSSNIPDCFNTGADEVIKLNEEIAGIALNKGYFNGEGIEGFRFEEMDERGVTKLWYTTEPLDGSSCAVEYTIDAKPLGTGLGALNGRDCIIMKLRAAGMECTFYIYPDGGEIDAESIEVSGLEHANYGKFGFGKAGPIDYYQY